MYLKIENVRKNLVRSLNDECGNYFIWARSNLVSYRNACHLAKIVTDGEHEFSYEVWMILDCVLDMWEHWNTPDYTIETVGTYKGVKFSFEG